MSLMVQMAQSVISDFLESIPLSLGNWISLSTPLGSLFAVPVSTAKERRRYAIKIGT